MWGERGTERPNWPPASHCPHSTILLIASLPPQAWLCLAQGNAGKGLISHNLPGVLRTQERPHPELGGGLSPLPMGPAQLRPPPGSGLLGNSWAESPVSYSAVSQERSHPLQSSGALGPGKKFHSWGLPGTSCLVLAFQGGLGAGWKHQGLGRRPRHRRLLPSA